MLRIKDSRGVGRSLCGVVINFGRFFMDEQDIQDDGDYFVTRSWIAAIPGTTRKWSWKAILRQAQDER